KRISYCRAHICSPLRFANNDVSRNYFFPNDVSHRNIEQKNPAKRACYLVMPILSSRHSDMQK
ncbi:hypothetical protein TNCV_1612241, partial [Trichonephila clavipes]